MIDAEVGQLGEEPPHVVVEREQAAILEQQDRGGRQMLGGRAQTEHGAGVERQVALDRGDAVGGPVNDLAAAQHRHHAAGMTGAIELGEQGVDARREIARTQAVAPAREMGAARRLQAPSSTPRRHQLPRSPRVSITLASRLAALRQLSSMVCCARSASPAAMASTMRSCSSTETPISLAIVLT